MEACAVARDMPREVPEVGTTCCLNHVEGAVVEASVWNIVPYQQIHFLSPCEVPVDWMTYESMHVTCAQVDPMMATRIRKTLGVIMIIKRDKTLAFVRVAYILGSLYGST